MENYGSIDQNPIEYSRVLKKSGSLSMKQPFLHMTIKEIYNIERHHEITIGTCAPLARSLELGAPALAIFQIAVK